MAPTPKTTTPKQDPTHPDLRAEGARALGMKAREIRSVVDIDAGRVIETFDGHRIIDIPQDRPDAKGHVGLAYFPTPGVPVPSTLGQMPVYTDDASANARPRTLSDLDAKAEHITIPPECDRDDYRMREWIGADPVRAWAVWKRTARQHRMTTADAGRSLSTCIMLRQIILGAGVSA